MKTGKERTASVESHPACSGEIVFIHADFLYPLLCHDVARCEEDLKIDKCM